MSEEFRVSRNVNRGPKEYLGSYKPVISKKEEREIEAKLGDETYVGIEVPESFAVVLYHTGMGREGATEAIKGKIRMAWYLQRPTKIGVMHKRHVNMMSGLKDGKVELLEFEDEGFIAVYTNGGTGYFSPIIIEDEGTVAHAYVKVQLKGLTEDEMQEARERKVVCILNETVELYTKTESYCSICCKEFMGPASSLFVNGGACAMAACAKCCSDIRVGRKPWEPSESNLNVLATAASKAESLDSEEENELFDYGNEKAMYGQKKKIYQESVMISRDNVKVESRLAGKRALSEREIHKLKKQCRATTKRIIDLQEQLDNFEEGYKIHKSKC
jgi:F0F1-type ATP synthase epsilon subunit